MEFRVTQFYFLAIHPYKELISWLLLLEDIDHDHYVIHKAHSKGRRLQLSVHLTSTKKQNEMRLIALTKKTFTNVNVLQLRYTPEKVKHNAQTPTYERI